MSEKLAKVFVQEYDEVPGTNGKIYYLNPQDQTGFYVADEVVYNLDAFLQKPEVDYIVVQEWKAKQLQEEFGEEFIQIEPYNGTIG